MQLSRYTKEIEEALRHKKWVIQNDLFIKRKTGVSYLETIYKIDNNRDKLTEDYYAYFDYLFLNDEEVIKALGGIYYEEYKEFASLYSEASLNKTQVIKECLEAVLELESIDINYRDVHAKNIIVNSKSHMRLVDLDEALPYIPANDRKLFLFIDLMLECFLFYDLETSIWDWIAPRKVLYDLNCKKALSSNFLDAIAGKTKDSTILTNIDKYLAELEDVEKVGIIRRELKQNYPKWFKE